MNVQDNSFVLVLYPHQIAILKAIRDHRQWKHGETINLDPRALGFQIVDNKHRPVKF